MNRKYRIFLITVLALTTVKMIFVGTNLDEGYGIELAWRIARGDLMIAEMWEPHQTSAIFGAVLVKLFWLFSGGSDTGLILYMHVWGVALQFLVAWFLYRSLKKILPEKMETAAFLSACIYMLSYPKGVISPEYSNLQNLFTTCSGLCFMLFMQTSSGPASTEKNPAGATGKGYVYLVLTGVFLSCAVLSYPSMVILYPVILILLCVGLKERRGQAVLAVTLPCLLLGGAFLLYLFSYMDMQQLMTGISYVLSDGSHSESLLIRTGKNLGYLAMLFLRIAVYMIAAFAGTAVLKRLVLKGLTKKQEKILSCFIALLISLVVQTGVWLFGDTFVNQPLAELLLLTVFAFVFFRKGSRTPIFYLAVFSVTGLVAATILSNFMLLELVAYLYPAGIAGMLMLWENAEKAFSEEGEVAADGKVFAGKRFQERITAVMAGLWVLLLCFGHVWVTSYGGEMHVTPFGIGNIQKSGPGIGILTNYMTGYRYNVVAERWEELIQEGESVLYAGPSSFYYMLGKDVVISAPNTISTPMYDETLLDYWEMYPERYPDVVLVESCYGEVMYGEDEFIMRWLNEDYQASSVTDYEYIRVYRK